MKVTSTNTHTHVVEHPGYLRPPTRVYSPSYLPYRAVKGSYPDPIEADEGLQRSNHVCISDWRLSEPNKAPCKDPPGVLETLTRYGKVSLPNSKLY
jgi:hypothetical protein